MKNYFRFFAACAILACFAFAIPGKKSNPLTIVIDVGHGGNDFGAKYGDYTEKDIVAEISRKVHQLNTNEEVVIHLTRTEDKFVSLDERVKAINSLKPDLVLSLHLNYEKTHRAGGMEFFTNEQGGYHAVKLERKFVDEAGYRSRGIKEGSFFILKKSNAPAISFELGFLSNETDRSYLTSQGKQEEIAKTIVAFINELK